MEIESIPLEVPEDEPQEKYRNLIVNHQGKKDITVSYCYSDPGFENIYDRNFRWDKICQLFKASVAESTKNDYVKLFQNDFSTTDIYSSTAGIISMMSSA